MLTTLSLLAVVSLVILANFQSGLAVLGTARNDVTTFLVQRHLLPNNAPPAPVVIKPAVVILPGKDGFSCVNDTSWSPDSKYVVILGYEQNCAVGGNTIPGLLTIHDAASGKRVRSFLLNDYIMTVFHRQDPKVRTQGVFYYHLVLWSHDRYHLAILFNVAFYQEPQSPSYEGLLLLNIQGGLPKVLLHLNQNGFMSYIVWDTWLDSEYTAPSAFANTSQNPGYTIQPTQFYRWGNGGGVNELQPVHDIPGPSFTSFAGPVGDPDGGNTFTLWQPGTLGLTTSSGNGSYSPGVGNWSTYFAAWSPDGRYIVDNLLVDGRFNIPGHPIPDHHTLVDLSMELLPLLPVRDKGLQRLLQNLAARPQPAGSIFIGESVSWRFDGMALAVYGPGDIYDTTVDIYRNRDGTHVATLLPSAAGVGILGGTVTLRWSDNGSHVLLFNEGLGTITIWNVPTAL